MENELILAVLHVSSPEGGEQDIQITHSPFNIGRIQPNDLVLPNAKVSRAHARILIEGERLLLIDLNSSNGTFVDAHRLTPNEPFSLSYGLNFEIGPFSLHLEPAAPAVSQLPVDEQPKRDEQVQEDEQPQNVPLPETAASDEPIGEAGSAEPEVKATQDEPVGVAVGVVDLPPVVITPPPDADGGGAGGSGNYDEAIGLPDDHSRYLQYLPPIYSEDNFLGKFLLAFEGVLTPIEQMVDNFDQYLDPRTAPAYFLDQLAAWLDLTLDEKWPLDKRRRIVDEAAELYRRRGTCWGLSRHLEIYTGVTPEIREPDNQPHHFEVVIKASKGTSLDRSTLERIIMANKPAHTTYKLEVTYV